MAARFDKALKSSGLRFTQYEDLTKEDVLNLLYDFVYLTHSYRETGRKYKLPEENVSRLVLAFKDDINNLTESWELMNHLPHLPAPIGMAKSFLQNKDVDNKRTAIHPNTINQEFLSLLSEPNDPILSEQEEIYAWVFAHTNNSEIALKEAKLHTGLRGLVKDEKGGEGESPSAKVAKKMRGYYLRNKPNIQLYIKQLREQKLLDLDVNKEFIQSQLVGLIEEIQSEGDPKNRVRLIKVIELLGKTIPGTFTENINISEVKPDEALDKLLEMARDVTPRGVRDVTPRGRSSYKLKDTETKEE